MVAERTIQEVSSFLVSSHAAIQEAALFGMLAAQRVLWPTSSNTKPMRVASKSQQQVCLARPNNCTILATHISIVGRDCHARISQKEALLK